MKKVLIGCGVLLALGATSVVGLILAAPAMLRWGQQQALDAVGGQLVGSIAVQKVLVVPDPPSADDDTSLEVEVVFAGTGVIPSDGLQLRVEAERAGGPEKVAGTAALYRTAGAGPTGVALGTATLPLGKLPEGTHKFAVAVRPPAQPLVGAVAPPREVQVVVGPGKKPKAAVEDAP